MSEQTLASFLLDRIAEDEAVARNMLARSPKDFRHVGFEAEEWANSAGHAEVCSVALGRDAP